MKYKFNPAFKSTRDKVKCKVCESAIGLGEMIKYEPVMRMLCHEDCADQLMAGESSGGVDMTTVCEVIQSAIDRLGETLKPGKADDSEVAGLLRSVQGEIRTMQGELSRQSMRMSEIETKIKAWE